MWKRNFIKFTRVNSGDFVIRCNCIDKFVFQLEMWGNNWKNATFVTGQTGQYWIFWKKLQNHSQTFRIFSGTSSSNYWALIQQTWSVYFHINLFFIANEFNTEKVASSYRRKQLFNNFQLLTSIEHRNALRVLNYWKI